MKNEKDAVRFELREWLPYALVITADEVSRAFAEVYRARYGLTRQQWRVLAAVAANPDATLADISSFSTLEKMEVSRAVAKLAESGLLTARTDRRDKRKRSLSLTRKGRQHYRELAELALRMEEELLCDLDTNAVALLSGVLAELRLRARRMRYARRSGL